MIQYVTQNNWIAKHDTKVFDFCHHCQGKCELSHGIPAATIRTSKRMLKEAKVKLIDSAYFFLIRSFRLNLLDKKELKQYCSKIGTSIEFSDIE